MSSRSGLCRTALVVLGCAFSAVLVSVPAVKAAESTTPPAAAEMQKLPLTATFDKKDSSGGPQYTLELKNDSKEALKVSAEIRQSVAVHNRPSSRQMTDHSIGAGKTWTIKELASLDKVTVTAKGYAPLELVVP